jgi:hypothetical protein
MYLANQIPIAAEPRADLVTCFKGTKDGRQNVAGIYKTLLGVQSRDLASNHQRHTVVFIDNQDRKTAFDQLTLRITAKIDGPLVTISRHSRPVMYCCSRKKSGKNLSVSMG